MIAVVQRVLEGSVVVDGEIVGSIQRGLVVLASVVKGDTDKELEWMANKLIGLRIFRDESGNKHFDRDVREIGGSILLVSNFTVAASTKQGRRPSLDRALAPAEADIMFSKFVGMMRRNDIPIETGRFGADMKVTIINDGPVTFIVDSAAS